MRQPYAATEVVELDAGNRYYAIPLSTYHSCVDEELRNVPTAYEM